MESVNRWNMFDPISFIGLTLNWYKEPPEPIYYLSDLRWDDQLIFHDCYENFTNIFWTSQKVNKYFAKELGEIYESRYLHM